MTELTDVRKIAAQFHDVEHLKDIKPYGNGHINTTYLLRYDFQGKEEKYILQMINKNVFKKLEQVMENIYYITEHLKKKIEENSGDVLRETLTVVKTKDGQLYFKDESGDYWREYLCIDNVTSYDSVECKDDFYNSAVSFGNFQKMLSDFPAEKLYETIVQFHDTRKRFQDFKKAVEIDVLGRADSVKDEIKFVMDREDVANYFSEMLDKKEIPLRVTHNDTKLNNILIDNETGKGICIIDLDTVMPGVAVFDFGDAIRFGASTGAEDEKDLDKISCDMDLFECYTKGFIEGCDGKLTEKEIRLLAMGAKVMTYECGMRFLTDYLQGDTYFRIHRKGHNLDRARTQFKLVADMESKWQEMNSIIENNKMIGKEKKNMNRQEYLAQIEEVIKEGPYDDTWNSLCEHPTPKWYEKGKFGIFIHWGVYSVPAFGNEWYPRNMYLKGSKENLHHVSTYGTLDKFGYKDFIPMFKGENFDPKEWADLFEEAGAKFVVPVAEHHDGFQMYASDLSHWNAAEMGPMRNIVGDLKGEVEKKGMVFGASSHRAEHYWFFNGARQIPEADVNDPQYEEFYGQAAGITRNHGSLYDNTPTQDHMEDWLVRTCELVDKYQPKLIFFDWWIQQYAWKPYLRKFAAYYYNRAAQWGAEVAIDSKFDAFVHGSAVKDIERGQLDHIIPDLWQNDTSVAKNSWGYTVGNDYKKPVDIVLDLVDVVSKNGALLLNVGPKADGTIPEEDAYILREVGKWLKVNGEAIYNTKYWKVFGEGPTVIPEGHFTDTYEKNFTSEDIRFTCRGNHIYAIILKWPEDGEIHIKALGNTYQHLKSSILDIELLGTDLHPGWFQNETLDISCGKGLNVDGMPMVLKITID